MMPLKRLTALTTLILMNSLSAIAQEATGEQSMSPVQQATIRRQARSDAVNDFNYSPWFLKHGAAQFCGLFVVTGLGVVPDYPYRSKLLEVALITGIPARRMYNKDVTIPTSRRNRALLNWGQQQDIYLEEYEIAIRQLRVFNTLSGAVYFSLSFILLKAILKSI